jgi:hypothetical protein
MVNSRLVDEGIDRFYLAYPEAFADPANITTAELNANPTNDPNGLIFNVTCALSTENTTFDLDEPDYDESTSFCQKAGSREPMSKNANVVFEFFRATDEMSTENPSQWNNAHLAFTLMAWRGQEFIAIHSIGERDDAPFEVGDEISAIQVATDHAVDNFGSGQNVTMTQNFAQRGVWSFEWPLAA